MLKVMLCGAADTEAVLEDFQQLAERMGFEAWSYLTGTIRYRNAATSSWRENSKASILQCDIAVFVVVERYGEIAWTAELVEALQAGLPFVVLCLDSTLSGYRSGTPGDPQLFEQLRMLEATHHVTLVPFSAQYFGLTLQQHLTALLEQATAALRQENARAIQRLLLTGQRDLTAGEVASVRELALDEFEDKTLRKRAIDVLIVAQGLQPADVLALAASPEQGVARKVLARLPEFDLGTDPASVCEELVEVVNESDDVGLYRRLVLSLLSLDLAVVLPALLNLRIEEVGTARRVLSQLDARADEADRLSAQDRALVGQLVRRCEGYRTVGKLDVLAAEVRRKYGVQ